MQRNSMAIRDGGWRIFSCPMVVGAAGGKVNGIFWGVRLRKFNAKVAKSAKVVRKITHHITARRQVYKQALWRWRISAPDAVPAGWENSGGKNLFPLVRPLAPPA